MYRDDATLTTEAVDTYGNTVTLTGHVRTLCRPNTRSSA
jgi:hypothetical protein